MKASYVLLCEYANRFNDGKMALVGIIETLTLAQDPHGPFQLFPLHFAARVVAEAGDPDQFPLRVRIVDEDMEEVGALAVSGTVNKSYPGVPRSVNLNLKLTELMLPGLGHYQFQLLVGDFLLGATPLYVRLG